MSLVFAIDELTVALTGLAIILTIALSAKASNPDTPFSKIINQAEVSKTRSKNESAVYRSRLAYNGLKTHYDGLKTLHEIFSKTVAAHPNDRCLGEPLLFITTHSSFSWAGSRELYPLFV